MHGISWGLGIDLSTCADVRICARDTRFSVKEVDIGMAADMGTLSRLPRVVGHFGWAKEVCLTARVFGADEALRAGFVNAVYPTKEDAMVAALDMAGLMASKSPVAVLGTKELMNWSRDHSVQDGIYIAPPPVSSVPCSPRLPPNRPPLHERVEQQRVAIRRRIRRPALCYGKTHPEIREAMSTFAPDFCTYTYIHTYIYIYMHKDIPRNRYSTYSNCPALPVHSGAH
jgi:hypothetical protein